MKTDTATALIVLAAGGVAVYFLYKTLNKTAQVACCVAQGVLHPTCVVANAFTAADNWANQELGFNTCGQ